jgi:hypothetical protein
MFPGQLRLQLGNLVLQFEDPADGDEAHPLADKLDGVLKVIDLMAGLTSSPVFTPERRSISPGSPRSRF